MRRRTRLPGSVAGPTAASQKRANAARSSGWTRSAKVGERDVGVEAEQVARARVADGRVAREVDLERAEVSRAQRGLERVGRRARAGGGGVRLRPVCDDYDRVRGAARQALGPAALEHDTLSDLDDGDGAVRTEKAVLGRDAPSPAMAAAIRASTAARSSG